jgi:nucleotide-binding universal stress UspA family protein
VVEDYPDDGICAAAREHAARLTVVGTHGRTGLRWLQMGSVAQNVVRHSETDVLVARRERREGYHSILVATDFSAGAERALDGAIALAAPGAAIDLVHYLDPARMIAGNFGASDVLSAARERMIQLAQLDGEQLVARRRAANLTLRFRASSERPVPGIIHAIEARPFDLVALGSHGRRGFRRFLLGSVAENVVRHAPCSVLVAHGLPDAARPT